MPGSEELLRAPRSLLCLVPRTVHTESWTCIGPSWVVLSVACSGKGISFLC